MAFLHNLQKVLRQNIREYGMFIALFVIMAIFTYTTDGVFISVPQHQQPAQPDRLHRRPGRRHDAGHRHPSH